jgi:hypothetical protein
MYELRDNFSPVSLIVLIIFVELVSSIQIILSSLETQAPGNNHNKWVRPFPASLPLHRCAFPPYPSKAFKTQQVTS